MYKNLSSILRNRIYFEQLEESSDGVGGIAQNWIRVHDCWAQISPINGSEVLEMIKLNVSVSSVITIRHTLAVKNKQRIIFGAKKYDIKYIINPMEESEVLKIYAQEISS